jgi:hypothetical protein
MGTTARGKLSWILNPPFQKAKLENAKRSGLSYHLHPSSAAVWINVDVSPIDDDSGIFLISRKSADFAILMDDYVDKNLSVASKVLYIGVFGWNNSPSFLMRSNDLAWLGNLSIDLSVEFFQN